MESHRNSPGQKPGIAVTIRQKLNALITLNNSPQGIALGVAIGVFIAVTPTYGFHTLLVVVAAFLVKRANKLAIFLGTNINTIFTFPFITWAGYALGRLILGQTYPALTWKSFSHVDYQLLRQLYVPLWIGSIILAVGLAFIFYLLTIWFLLSRQRGQFSTRVKTKG